MGQVTLNYGRLHRLELESDTKLGNANPAPFFPNPGFGFPGIPGLQKPGFRVCDHETRV